MPLGLNPMCSDPLCDIPLATAPQDLQLIVSPDRREQFCRDPQAEMPE